MWNKLRQAGNTVLKFVSLSNEAAGRITTVVLVLLILMICVDVIGRYLFNHPLIWANELSLLVQTAIAWSAIGYILKEDAHIQVHVLTQRLKARARNQLAVAAGVVYEGDIAKAKALLKEAGKSDLGFEVIISELATSYRKPLVALQAQLKKSGIDMKLKVVDHSSFHSLIRKDASPLVYYACWRPNSDVFLTRFYHSASEVVKGKKPDTGFSHYGAVDADGDGNIDSIDDLIAKAEEAFEKRQRLEEKIRMAQSKLYMKSPREILKGGTTGA